MSRRKFWVERLEERYLLTATPLEIGFSAPDPTHPAQVQAQAQAQAQAAMVNAVSFLPVATFPLEETFLLHSNPSATKVIYLDFDGFLTRNTPWNTAYNQPNIVTPSFSLDEDLTNFSDDEKIAIQFIWESVREDFRPFNVDVTTEDPGVENLINSGVDEFGVVDEQWGIRLAIGGSDGDWQYPVTGHASGGIAYINSFNDGIDQPAFSFAADSSVSYTAETISHEAGHALGLVHDGQIRFWRNSTDKPTDPSKQKNSEYYPGHAILSDPLLDPDGNVIGFLIFPNDSPTGWSPIMGGAANLLTQWSFGEYPGADNIEDDLAKITDGHNGFTWSADDHSDTTASATPLELSSETYFGEGVIGEHPSFGVSDVDTFTFTVEGTGEFLSFDISPAQISPNLDILAKLYNAAGVLIGTSNPRDFIDAGSQTADYPNIDPNDEFFDDPNLGWRVQVDTSTGFVSPPDESNENLEWRNLADLLLQPGTYYISVEGTGKPATYINPDIYPGPIIDPPGAPDASKVVLPPDDSDWGYSNYGSLGYYSILGKRQKGSLVGVDFDIPDGETPQNWNLFEGSAGQTATLTDLVTETGAPVPYTLTISTTGPSLQTFASDEIDIDLPDHHIALDTLNGYLSGENGTETTFTWNNLTPSSYHTIYVFAHADFNIDNVVTVTGRYLSGDVQTISFRQVVGVDRLMVNEVDDIVDEGVNNGIDEGEPRNEDLTTYAIETLSDSSGHISIKVTNAAASEHNPNPKFAIAGLAITPDRRIASPQNGSISGQKWNDLDGDHVKDSTEPGLEGWTIYIDENNNGKLDTITIPGDPAIPGIPGETQTVSSAANMNLPIQDQDNEGLFSSLAVEAAGTVVDISVTVNISHTWVSDLKVELISPSGKHVKLVTARGDDGDNFQNTVFDDSASISISNPEASAPFTGTFRPEESLLHDPAAFDGNRLFGQAASGTWKLWIRDTSLGDVGTLNSWSMTITDSGTPDIPATPDTFEFAEPNTLTLEDGTYSFDDLPPSNVPYRIREYFDPDQVTAGWTQTWAPTPVTMTSGADIVDQDFGNWIPPVQHGSIEGQMFFDADQDGVKDGGETGLPNWIVYLDTDNDGIRDVSSGRIEALTEVAEPIVDLTTIQSQLAVVSTGSVFDVEVTVDITHSFMADLEAYLTSPSGRRVLLFSHVGGQYNDFYGVTFSDSAVRSINTISFNDLPYEDSTWKPEEALSAFIGDEAAGVWTLSITDTVEEDEGSLNSWSLSFLSSEPFRTTDASGKYQFENVDPGNYIVREEVKSGWNPVAPADTTITGATWAPIPTLVNPHWDVSVDTLAVQSVDFGNFTSANLPGDFNRDLVVNASDQILWRKTLGSNVTNFSGADGDGNGIVEPADLAIWRANFGSTLLGSGSGSGLATVAAASGAGSGLTTVAAASGAETRSVEVSEPVPAVTAPEPLSTEPAPLSTQVAADMIAVTTRDSAQSPAIEVSETAPAVTALEPLSTEPAPLSTQVASNVIVVATGDSAQSPAGSILVYELVGPNSVIEHGATIIERPSESTSHSDLGLLAWLAASSVGDRPQSDVMSLTDDDLAASHLGDESETVDVAFELLEGNALVSAAI